MKFFDTEAVVVGRRRLSGADRLVTLITPELGRISAVARGVKLARSPIGSALEPFGVARVVLAPARASGLHRVESADRVRPLSGIGGDLARTQGAGLVCAWSRALAREEASPDGYRLLVDTLERLNEAGARVAPEVAGFLWELTAISGVRPELSRCVACGTEPPFAAFRLNPGGGVCGACREGADPALADDLWAGLAALARGQSHGHPDDLPEPAARPLVALAQTYLRAHFGERLP